MKILPERIMNILGKPSPPPRVWEQQFDGDQAELESLVSRDWKEIKLGDLYIYFLDLMYVELQPDLFRYLFPICLYRWYESLMENKQDTLEESYIYECLEKFHFGMGNGYLLQSMTSPDEREDIYAFFHDALIERIEAERGFSNTGYPVRDYKWIFRLYDICVFAPVIDRIWTTWWILNSPGKAVSAIIYASSLVYLEGENPIFDPIFGYSYGEPYTISAGTGGCWLIENSQFMEKTLNVEYIQTKLIEAAERLSTEPEGDIAFQVAEDALKLERDEIIALRLAAVIATH